MRHLVDGDGDEDAGEAEVPDRLNIHEEGKQEADENGEALDGDGEGGLVSEDDPDGTVAVAAAHQHCYGGAEHDGG